VILTSIFGKFNKGVLAGDSPALCFEVGFTLGEVG
jgi:hypothetical protein